MKLKGYFDCLEKRLKCLSPILPYLESKEGIQTPLRVGGEIRIEEIIERMVDSYEGFWSEPEIDELLAFFGSPVGRTLITSYETLAAKLSHVLDGYILEKTEEIRKTHLH
jgi:hypothetical protein